MMVILTGVKWYLIVVLIWIPLINELCWASLHVFVSHQWCVWASYGWDLCWVFVCLIVFPLMGRLREVELLSADDWVCILFCLLFTWGVLHRVLLGGVISHVIRVWSATGSLRDEPCDQCRINYVISAWSVTWSVHDQSRDQCMISHVISAWSAKW